ncbi:MAG: hypothetical protein COA42_01320 [Alteromonadaceae bacterium]|nr:MAG: hypothetical protein COA42_01320 [Alteromonadaceae bacterium]
MTLINTSYWFPLAALICLHSAFVLPTELNGFDISKNILPLGSIQQGGPPKDGIPAILSPRYLTANKAKHMRDDDMILGFLTKNQSFAYPRYIMNWHEIVNDEVNDNAFIITYCPLCGTGMAFSSNISNRLHPTEKTIFGISGLLYNSDVLLYDKNTESLWSQMARTAVSGIYAGTALKQLNLEHTTWAHWVSQHPETKVLSEAQGFSRDYRRDPYSGYETSSRLYFKTLRRAPKTYHPKERILGVQFGSLSKAYPFTALRKHNKQYFRDKIGKHVYYITWHPDHQSASVRDASGKTTPSTIAYWFAWFAFHPDTQVFQAENTNTETLTH